LQAYAPTFLTRDAPRCQLLIKEIYGVDETGCYWCQEGALSQTCFSISDSIILAMERENAQC